MSKYKTPLLDSINTPKDLRKLEPDVLTQLAGELRTEMIHAGLVAANIVNVALEMLGINQIDLESRSLFTVPKVHVAR